MQQSQLDLTIYTAGYQGRLPADLADCARYLSADVVDIRLSPFSQQPGWSKPDLQALLGQQYLHIPALGNINYKSGSEIRIADLTLGLKILLAPRRMEASRPAILLCGCRDAKACHRSTVAAALRDQGICTEELNWEATSLFVAPPTLQDLPVFQDPLILQELRDTLTRLHERVIRLRCEDPTKVTRAELIAHLQAQVDKLTAQSVDAGGTENGWPDPGDVFADADQVDGLREALAELTRPNAPYPAALPPGCWLLPTANFDAFAVGRMYNGKLALSKGGEAKASRQAD